MARLLSLMGKRVELSDDRLVLTETRELSCEAPYEIVKQMRASYYVLGPLLARKSRARVSLPGGCAIGPRPVDLHVKGMAALGARVVVEHGYINAEAERLRGTEMVLGGSHGPSVGATANVMMAATLAQGRTVVHGAACEPEIVCLAEFLNGIGARIVGAGTPTIAIEGVEGLTGGEFSPIPDRIEAGTLALAVAVAGGEVEVAGCRPEHMSAVIEKLREAGMQISTSCDSLVVISDKRPVGVDITTAPYPGFPTDCQAQFMALLCLAEGRSVVTEHVFENRFLHAQELNRMGAKISIDANRAVINGVARLSGAQVMASDIRASASLVLAGLAADGETEISRIYHLDRGYEGLEQKLASLGARVRRVK